MMTIENVKLAYRKLKHSIYYDTTYSFIRSQLADFEQDNEDVFTPSPFKIQEILEEIKDKINNKDESYFDKLIQDIHFWRLPKKIENDTIGGGDSTILTNAPKEDVNIKVTRDFRLVNADIKLHLVTVLWIMKGGYLLEEEMKVKPYGNKLELKSDEIGIVEGLRLFKPYYKRYQMWRDNAFKKAKQIISENENVLLISLDVKEYYPSVNLDFSEFEKLFEREFNKGKEVEELEEMKFLNLILKNIHKKYAKIHKTKINNDIITGLPIGLQSSAVIGNWFLRKLDDKVRKTINPAYYARYVDDIMLVIANPYIEIDKENNLRNSIFKRYFVDNKIFSEKPKTKKDEGKIYTILLNEDKNSELEIQGDKSRLYYFDKNQPTALLDKIERELQIESSEFRYLPEEKTLFQDFYTESHYLSFDGSVNKLRNVSGFGINLFGASRYLAKKIFSSLQTDRKPDKKAARQLNIFFKGARAIETAKLWEKAATYFIVTKDAKGLLTFAKNIETAIEKIEFEKKGDKKTVNNEEKTKEIKLSLYQSLAGSVSMAFALDTEFMNKNTEGIITKVIELIEKHLNND